MAKSPFNDAWATALVAASAERELVPGLCGIVGFGVGKKIQATVSIVDGRAQETDAEEPGVHIPFTGAQALAWRAGELNLTQAYTKGDLKPVGRTGDLLAALELLDDPAVIAGMPPTAE